VHRFPEIVRAVRAVPCRKIEAGFSFLKPFTLVPVCASLVALWCAGWSA
jgi:hypothetical protein